MSPQETGLRLRSLSPMPEKDSFIESTVKIEDNDNLEAKKRKSKIRLKKPLIKRTLRQTKYRKMLEEADNSKEINSYELEEPEQMVEKLIDEVKLAVIEESSSQIEKIKFNIYSFKNYIFLI